VESRTASGLVIAHRAAFPRDSVPADEPAELVNSDVVEATNGATPMSPQRWAGWPPNWGPPTWNRGASLNGGGWPSGWWGRVETLTDTAWGCLDLNARVFAAMPPYLVNAAPSLDADWLKNPDPLLYRGWSQFAKQLLWDYQLGEAFVMPTAWYASGWPSRFHVVPPWLVTSDVDLDGLPRHKIGNLDVTDLILHIPYQIRTDEARGHGPLEAGSGRVVAASALARYATDLAVAGGLPYALLVHPGRLTADQAAELKWQWVGERMAAMGLPGVLSGGVDLKVLSFDPEKMALVDLAGWTEARIAFLLGVPPPMAALPSGQDSLTYNTTVMARDQHWQAGLNTFVVPLMEALSGWALPRGTTVEVNRDEYVRPALNERAEAYATLFGLVDEEGNRAITIAEIREAERYDLAAPSQTLTSGVLQ
jgi:hypothetical protein